MTTPSQRALILYRRRCFINHTYLLTYFGLWSLSPNFGISQSLSSIWDQNVDRMITASNRKQWLHFLANLWSQSEFMTQRWSQRKTKPKSDRAPMLLQLCWIRQRQPNLSFGLDFYITPTDWPTFTYLPSYLLNKAFKYKLLPMKIIDLG